MTAVPTDDRRPDLDGAPLFLLDELPDVADLLVGGAEGRHAVDVLRLTPGERVRARRTIPVKVPAGVEDGMRIRLTGHGEVGPGGGPAGDLYVEIAERPHDVFTRDGEDLHCRVTLPMTAAALGTTLTLETLDGQEEVDIRPGTQSGSVLTLRAKGAPRLRATGRGNLMVHVEVETPTRLDAEQEKLLRELASLRGEDRPAAADTEGHGGLFSRLFK